MFLTLVRKAKQKENELRLLILGLDNAGKSTLLKQYLGENVDDVTPTVGFTIKTHHTTIEEKRYRIHFWDIGGQVTIRHFWKQYYDEGADGIIWVIDGTDESRLVKDGKEMLKSVLSEGTLQGASIVLLINKCDLPGCMNVKRVKEIFEDMHDLLAAHSYWILPTCAVDGRNVTKGFSWLLSDIASRL